MTRDRWARRGGRRPAAVVAAVLLMQVVLGVRAPNPAAGAAPVADWELLPPDGADNRMESARMVNDHGYVVGSPAAASARMWFDPTTGTTSTLDMAGGSVVFRDLNEQDEVIADTIGFLLISMNLRTRVITTFPTERQAIATALNDGGTAVGYYGQPGANATSWMWRRGAPAPVAISPPGGRSFAAFEINESEQVAGIGQRADGSWGAFLLDLGTGSFADLGPRAATDIVDLNEDGIVVGRDNSLGADESWYWSPTDPQQHVLPGGAIASAISDTGIILMMTLGPVVGNGSVLYATSTGVVVPLAVPSGAAGYATALNDRGQVTGQLLGADGSRHVVRWEPDGSATDLGLPPSTEFGTGLALSDDGTVVGQAVLAGAGIANAFVATLGAPTPPTTPTSSTSSTSVPTTEPGAADALGMPAAEAAVPARAVAGRPAFAG